jgi:hypothetical protein
MKQSIQAGIVKVFQAPIRPTVSASFLSLCLCVPVRACVCLCANNICVPLCVCVFVFSGANVRIHVDDHEVEAGSSRSLSFIPRGGLARDRNSRIL